MCAATEEKKSCFNSSRELIIRLLYGLHGVASIYILYINKEFEAIHCLLFVPLLLLFLESVSTICQGHTYDYVWPCGFFYLASIVPIIWLLQLGLLEKRQISSASNSTLIIPEFLQSWVEKHVPFGANNRSGGPTYGARQMLIETMTISDGRGIRIAELGVVMGIIFGRWLSPDALKGKELSALLLSYVGNAADILEVLESLGTEGVTYSKFATIGILGIYTWALLQFTLITSWERDEEKDKENTSTLLSNTTAPSTLPSNTTALSTLPSNTMAPSTVSNLPTLEDQDLDKKDDCKVSILNCDAKERSTTSCCSRYYHKEFPQMFVLILMQDGPFLFLRLTLCIKYHIFTELHIFFMCKNALVCILLVYRFFVLLNEQKEKRSRPNNMVTAVAISKARTRWKKMGNENKDSN